MQNRLFKNVGTVNHFLSVLLRALRAAPRKSTRAQEPTLLWNQSHDGNDPNSQFVMPVIAILTSIPVTC
jgi:hypothetical protein